MNYSYGSNADKYLNEEGLKYLIEQLDLKYSGGSIGNDGRGIQSVELVNYELIVTLTDATVINLGNVRGLQGIQGIKGLDGINGIDGTDGTNGTNGTNGKGITTIVKTGTVDLVDTYTITYSDATTSTFTVTNGSSGEGGTGSSLEIYSTDETTIGTWIDGKTIYRKVYTGNSIAVPSGNSVTESITHGVANISQIVKIGVIINVNALVYTGNGIMINGCTNTAIADIEKSTVWLLADLTTIYFVHGLNWGSNRAYKIIFEYTKTV